MPSFDSAQIETISRTVFAYEQARCTDLRKQVALFATEVLAFNELSSPLRWNLKVKLGALPADVVFPYEDHHPLEFAAAFREHPAEREHFLRHLRRDLELYRGQELSVPRSARPGRTWPLPGPPADQPKLEHAVRGLFHPTHAAWYMPQALTKLASGEVIYQTGIGSFLFKIGCALERAGEDPTILEAVATRCACVELDKKPTTATDYTAIAEALYFANQYEVEEALLRLKGSMKILGVTLRNPHPTLMIASLRQLASSKRLEVMSRMQRSPTLDELLQSNVKGIGVVWRFMPWALLEPVIRDHGPALQGALFRRAEMSHSELRECLIDHEQRYKQVTIASETSPVVTTRWEAFRSGLLRYFPALQIRAVLKKHQYPDAAARLIVFQHLTKREDLRAYTEPLLVPELAQALASYPTPLEPAGESAFWYKEAAGA